MDEGTMKSAVNWMLDGARLTPVMPGVPATVDVAVRSGAGKRLLLLTNYDAAPQTIALAQAHGGRARRRKNLFRDPATVRCGGPAGPLTEAGAMDASPYTGRSVRRVGASDTYGRFAYQPRSRQHPSAPS